MAQEVATKGNAGGSRSPSLLLKGRPLPSGAVAELAQASSSTSELRSCLRRWNSGAHQGPGTREDALFHSSSRPTTRDACTRQCGHALNPSVMRAITDLGSCYREQDPKGTWGTYIALSMPMHRHHHYCCDINPRRPVASSRSRLVV